MLFSSYNMTKVRKTLKNLLYAGAITLAGFLNMSRVEGQYADSINLFQHPIASPYDTLRTKEERDTYVLEWLKQDFVNTIPPHLEEPLFDCTQYSNLLSIDAYGTTSPTAFWGYNGNNLDSIYKYGGTLKYNGNGKLPIICIIIPTGAGHEMNGIYTGDDLTWESFCAIEPQTDKINVQPGEWDIPMNCNIYVRGPSLPENTPINSPFLIKYEIKEGIVSKPIFDSPIIDQNYVKLLIKYRDSINSDLENKINNSEIKFYPNPVKNIGIFEFENNENKEVYLEIYDVSGRVIGKKSENDEKIEFDFSDFSSGIYFYKIKDSENLISRGKIIKD